MTIENEEVSATEDKKARRKKAPEIAPEFAFDFLEAEGPFVEVAPSALIFAPFDSRANSEELKLDPKFVESIKSEGILQPPLATPVRERATGKTGLMLIAGRQRVRAAKELGLKTIQVSVKTMTLLDAHVACIVENTKRKGLSFWDEAINMRRLRDEAGMKQGDIAKRLGFADSKISQYLAVFDLDERVQKLVARGTLDPGANTKVRALKGIEDPDMQYGLATKAIEQGWSAEEIEVAVAKLKAKAEEKARREREKAKAEGTAGTRGRAAAETDDGNDEPKFDSASIEPVKKAALTSVVNHVYESVQRLKAKDGVDPEKLAYEQGKLDGLKMAAGLKSIPKSVLDK